MAALKNQLKSDLVAAMKAGDNQAKAAIRMALTAINTEEVSGTAATELDDRQEQQVLQREINKRKDAAEAYRDAGRAEQAENEEAEAELLQKYLPAPLTNDEMEQLVTEVIAEFTEENGSAPSMRDMGAIMKQAQLRADGRADGKTLSGIVRGQLSS